MPIGIYIEHHQNIKNHGLPPLLDPHIVCVGHMACEMILIGRRDACQSVIRSLSCWMCRTKIEFWIGLKIYHLYTSIGLDWIVVVGVMEFNEDP